MFSPFWIVFGVLSGVYWLSRDRPVGAGAGFALAAFGLIGLVLGRSNRETRRLAYAVPVLLVIPVIALIFGDSLSHGIENATVSAAIVIGAGGGAALFGRFADRDDVRHAAGVLERTWPNLFWTAFVAAGTGLCVAGYWAQGILVLLIPGLIASWRGIRALFRRVTYDPWRE